MNILVCIKEVPETEAPIAFDEKTGRLLDSHSFRMSRYDECALEEAVRIKESVPETVVDVLTVGPDRSVKVLTRAVGMGANRAALIRTGDPLFMRSFTTASMLAAYAATKSYDLIFTGVMSDDAMQGQTGPMIAELLSMPCATSVVFVRLSSDMRTVYVEREIESGQRDCVELNTPALLTIQSGINTPRYPTLSGMLRAKKMDIETIDTASLSAPEARESIVGMGYPEKTRSGLVLEGTPLEKAAELVRILNEKSLLD